MIDKIKLAATGNALWIALLCASIMYYIASIEVGNPLWIIEILAASVDYLFYITINITILRIITTDH